MVFKLQFLVFFLAAATGAAAATAATAHKILVTMHKYYAAGLYLSVGDRFLNLLVQGMAPLPPTRCRGFPRGSPNFERTFTPRG